MVSRTRPRPPDARQREEQTTSRSTIPERPIGRSATGLDLTTLDGRYHVVDRIAAGGMGEVFRAHDAVLAREVAIKVLHRTLAGDPGFVDRFRLEARAAAGLSHPNIVAVHDWGSVDGIYFMVMEFVRGQSLREILNAEGVLAPAQAAEILLQVLSALDHAHRQGIVHRDVKPENVMVTRDGVAKVTDFGLARAYADAQVTQAGTVTGTVQYLAPEQLQGEPADPRTDLYSLGIVAFELLTGHIPFTAETPMAIAYKHIRDRVPPPSSRNPAVPKGIDGWVASMTEKSRELRPASAAEARRDLQDEARSLPAARPIGELVPDVALLPSEPGPERATTVTIPRTPGRRPKRRLRRWLFGILLALAAIGAAAWGTWTYLVPHEADVPRVIGLSMEDAQASLETAGFVVRIADGRYDASTEAGTVLAVRPAEGATLRTGSPVSLVPSLGPPPVPVPDVYGLTVPQAEHKLNKAKLALGEQVREYSDEIAEGRIIQQSVAADDEAPQGSAIDVVVSRGPEPAPIPKVIGKSEEHATSILEAAGFLVDREEDYSETVPRGDVISQEPQQGTKLQPGEAVTIVISLGPREFELPSFLGMTKDAAVARIRELGLVPAVVPVPGSNGDTVVSQLPAAGSTVKAGQTITIYVA